MNTKKTKRSILNKRLKVFVGMSGGVDSSVAALLLQKQGHEVVGCFIKGWYPAGFYCSWREDRRDAMRVCARLKIPFITIDAEKEYKKEVVDYMVSEFKAGRTPNPDVMCNKYIKFGVFLKKALGMGADFIATGHYVKIKKSDKGLRKEHFSLFQAYDLNKDQSYFLWALTQQQLRHCLFPLGGMLKPEVKKIARASGLITADKKESMGVCFIGEFNINEFLKKYIKPKKGKIITIAGEVIGEHEGVQFYTIGQRHGFSSASLRSTELRRGESGVPYYIVAKDIKKNIIIVADKSREEKYYKKEVELRSVNWLAGSAPDTKKIYQARIRYRQPLQSCRIKGGKTYKVVFTKPQRAVTAGQSIVVYDKQNMLGGGIIV